MHPAPIICLLLCLNHVRVYAANQTIFDVKHYGATGKRTDDARPAIQKTIDACAASGGGTVRLPRGQYTSGTLHLRSHIHFHLDRGATLYATHDTNAYDCGPIPSKAALLYGEDLQDISFEGSGTIDGQAEYEWRPDDFERAFKHKTIMERLGKSLMRSVPKGFPEQQIFPHLVWLGRSKDIRFTGLKFLHSPNWSIALYACERARFDKLYIYTSLKEAVWADGLDLDGCKNVSISNCTIETGDDCIALVSAKTWGPALPCENIRVTHCHFASASAGIKFSEGNIAGIRDIQVSKTVFENVNRGIVFNNTLGGAISNVVLSDLTINCNRFDWFWAGDGQPFFSRITRLSELDEREPQPGEAPPGSIRNVLIRNVDARAKGSSLIHGHPESWLDGITLENVKLAMSMDPSAPFDQAEHALEFRWARNVKLKNVKVEWAKPRLNTWKSAAYFENIDGLEIAGFKGSAAWPERGVRAVEMKDVSRVKRMTNDE